MKIFKHIFSIMAAFTLLTACTEELDIDDFQLSDITIKATWDGDHPVYSVEYTNCAPEDISEIGIRETFIDNQWHNNYENQRTIKLSAENLTASDKKWNAYPGDEYEAFAFIRCKNGNFRSEQVKVAYPAVETKITSASIIINYPGNYTLVIEGQGFKIDETYRLASSPTKTYTTDTWDFKITPNSIKIPNYEVGHSGIIDDVLYMGNKALSFQVSINGTSFESVSKTSIVIGEPIIIKVPGTSDDDNWRYMFENGHLSQKTGETYTVYPYTRKTGSVWVKMMDQNTGFFNDSVKIDIKCPAWNKVASKSLSTSLVSGNNIYDISTQDGKATITSYDITTGKQQKTFTMATDFVNYVDCILTEGSNMYIAYSNENGKYIINVLNMSTSKSETLATVPQWVRSMWLEGSALMAETNEGTYKITNGKATLVQSLSDNYFRFIGKDNGYVYGYISTHDSNGMLVNNINRYKEGQSSSLEQVGSINTIPFINYTKESCENTPLYVNDGYLYHSIVMDESLAFAYKTKISSMKSNPETESLGNVAIANKLSDSFDTIVGFYTDGSNYYYIANTQDFSTIILKSTGK